MSAPGSFVPSAAFKAALFAVIARSIAAQTANGNPVRREGSEDDGEIDIRAETASGPGPLASLLAAVLGPVPLCDDPACEACTAARAVRAAKEKQGSSKADATNALLDAAAAMRAASEAIERAAQAVALAKPERA